MTPRDRAWEMAGLARQDGDSSEERRWTNIARGLPPDTVRKRCWACVGRGVIIYPYQPLETCGDCRGQGWIDV